MHEHTPVLIGAAQAVQKDVEPERAEDPIGLCARTSRLAAEDAGAGRRLLEAVDTLAVVNILCWDHGDAPRLLAESLDIHPRTRIYTTIGGNTPQSLVNEMADRIANGRAEVVLLAGAEAFFTGRAAHRARIDLGWPKVREASFESFGDARLGVSDLESRHGLRRPSEIYPLFENALRAHLGRGLDEHRMALGRLYAPFSETAAANPYAWFRRARTAAEIATPSADNRYVGFPYTKLMNAIMMVDQSAALLMASEAAARRLGIDESRWVYPIAGTEAFDHFFVSERPDLHDSPACRVAVRAALEAAELDPGALDAVDFYSCFPCAVEIAQNAAGLADDGMVPTLTGGLAYFGGAGNNYSMHALAEVVQRLRARRDSVAMTTALGWFMTKHAVGVYAGRPSPRGWSRPASELLQAEVDRLPRLEVAAEAEGPARVDSYTVLYDRSREPVAAVVLARLEDGHRVVAETPVDAPTVAAFTLEEGVGKTGRLRCRDGIHRFTLS